MLYFTDGQLEAARAAKAPEKLIEIASEAGVELTREQAEGFLSPPSGELSEEEIANVTGGGRSGSGERSGAGESWGGQAAAEGYIYYLNLPCPTCGKSSLYSTYHDWLTMVDGHQQERFFNIKCFNCNAKFDQVCDGVFSSYG